MTDPLDRFAARYALHRRSVTAIDLAYPNPRVVRDPTAIELLRATAAAIGLDELQYTPFGGRRTIRRRIAAAFAGRTGVAVGADDLFLTPGATAALVVVVDAFLDPGDEVLIVAPGWMDYELYLERRGVRAQRVGSAPDKSLDPAAIAARCGPRTAGVIISQPACPTGVVHPASAINALAAVLTAAARARGRRILLISDEVHRDQVWAPDTPLTLPMSVYPDTISVYSYGKAWSMQGQRAGYLALGPGLRGDRDRGRVIRALRTTGACAPTSLMQAVIARLASGVPDQEQLRNDQRYLREALTQIGYDVVPGAATSFVYVRCPHHQDDWSFVEALARHGILAFPSSIFHEAGYFRLSLNGPAEERPEIVRRLRQAWQESNDRGSR